ncbi:hypothetical protein ACIP5Y_34260 [Nocardia sp. NPDC088792]|uniref:hypothetical protein n=1 Tax=Nocardia sp. NPDC088792 TaxID=3364332 RepID=UPI0037F97CDF
MTSGNGPNEAPRPGPEPDWWQAAATPESPRDEQPDQGERESGQPPAVEGQTPISDAPPAFGPPVYGAEPPGYGAQPPGFGSPPPNYGGGQGNPQWQPGGTPPPTAPITGGSYPGQSYPGGYGQDPYQSQPYQPTQQFPAGPQFPPPPGQFGPPGYGPPPGGGRRRGWLLGGIGLLVVVIIGVVLTLVLVNRHSGTPSAKSIVPSPLDSVVTTTPNGSQNPSGTPAPVIPGFQVVTIPDNGAAYDVPADWKIDQTGQTAFGSGADQIPIAGLAQDGVEYCPNYVRTNVFLSQSDEQDPTKAATDIATRMGRVGWTSSTGTTVGAAEQFSSSDGQLQGVYMESKGNAPAPAAGCASTYSIYTFAFPGDNGAFVFTIAADTGVDKSVDATLAKKILASIRPM